MVLGVCNLQKTFYQKVFLSPVLFSKFHSSFVSEYPNMWRDIAKENVFFTVWIIYTLKKMYANLFCTFFLRKDGLKLIFHPKRFFYDETWNCFVTKCKLLPNVFQLIFHVENFLFGFFWKLEYLVFTREGSKPTTNISDQYDWFWSRFQKTQTWRSNM